jgi:hypothetical protein
MDEVIGDFAWVVRSSVLSRWPPPSFRQWPRLRRAGHKRPLHIR